MAAELGALSGTRAQKRPSASAGPASLGSPAPVDPGPMSVSGSPKRFLVNARVEAPSPLVPTRDMTVSELTHAYQHLAAQAALDKAWSKMVDGAITDHALWLDRDTAA